MASENKPVHFQVNASLFGRLAEQMFPDELSSLTELVKNSYDAGASYVNITISSREVISGLPFRYTSESPGFISVEDDGVGMTRESFLTNWLMLASKTSELFSTQGRIRMGGQGFGRLSCLRLGKHVELFSTPRAGGSGFHAAFSCDKFLESAPVEEIPVWLNEWPGANKPGTRIYLFPPLIDWSQVDEEKFGAQLKTRVYSLVGTHDLKLNVSINRSVPVPQQSGKRALVDRAVVFQNVSEIKTPEFIQELVSFYERHQLIRSGFSPEERARQALIVVRDKKEKNIVGLSSVDLVKLKQFGNNVFFLYRCVILPEYRHPGLDAKLLVETRDFLEQSVKGKEKDRPVGLLAFVENPRLQQAKRQAIWAASQMAFAGVDKKGRQMRIYYFKGATI